MTDAPWAGDAVSLVDAFRAGERSPVEELDATLAAIEAIGPELLLARRRRAGPRRGRGAPTSRSRSAGCPPASRSSSRSTGWPYTEASLVFKDRDRPLHRDRRRSPRSTAVARCRSARPPRASSAGSTSASRSSTASPTTPGSTAARSAVRRAVPRRRSSGGLVTLATGGDGGGSIRIPAGYTGLLGMKGTFGRIPRSPHAFMRPNTVVLGNLARSVRDAARYFDVCGGYDTARPDEPAEAPRLRGRPRHPRPRGQARRDRARRSAGVTLEPGVEEQLRAEADALIAATGHGAGRPRHRASRTSRRSG